LAQTKVLLKNIGTPNSEHIDSYLKNNGYRALEQALKNLVPEEVVDIVRRSGLRGRGGAGFPTGMKWQFCASDNKTPKYVICNADEGEPGTFKDRILLEQDPHAILEGMALAGYAIGAEEGLIYIRGEYIYALRRLQTAIEQARERGFLGRRILGSDFSFDIKLFLGAGAYICGEETALLDSLEGKAGRSRIKPPFPVNEGLWQRPTSVNNVETLGNIPHIILNGPEWFKGLGTAECPGTKIFAISGHVNKPGNYELPMGVTLKELIYEYAGGIRNGKEFKAVLPGGASSPCLTSENLSIMMDFNSLAAAGSMLGSGAVIVMDHTTCLVGASLAIVRFFRHESCGRCTPCREGTYWIVRLLERIMTGVAQTNEIDLILSLGQNMRASCFCPLGLAAQGAVLSFIEKFRDEFEGHIKEKHCPVGH
jgi:NADH-quinone oxidoreductase subunit F